MSDGTIQLREGAIWYDGKLYRTVLTPTQLPDKAPDHSFDVLYNFSDEQASVADAAPRDKDYNGGRWIVYSVTVNFLFLFTFDFILIFHLFHQYIPLI